MANNNFNAPAFPDEKNSGLTKLEYAVIHLTAGGLAADRKVDAKHIIDAAKILLTELEKSNQ